MKKLKILSSLFVAYLLLFCFSFKEKNSFLPGEESDAYFGDSHTQINKNDTVTIPLAGNAFVTVKPEGAGEVIGKTGLADWSNSNSVISTYVKTNAGRVALWIKVKVAPSDNKSVVEVSVNGTTKSVTMEGTAFQNYYVGEFNFTNGYNKIDLKGVSNKKDFFGDVSHIVIAGDAVANALYASKPDFYYWARRGPSCHITYTIPTTSNVTYYYSEIVVPAGEDKIGSYFMANGFAEGYFGIQVNAATERRVLFSVWSPYNTDDPTSIPEDQKIKLNRKGADVKTGEFGNEGSGGQSYFVYNWKAGNTYQFLLKGQPDGQGKTDYTAWFYAPEAGQWKLIASFKRPKTNTYLNRFHSFLENFIPDNGYMSRTATYKNQWVYDVTNTWHKVEQAKFTVDATFKANQRVDATGGINSDGYFLRNGGFFSDNNSASPGQIFSYNNTQGAPDIDFNALP